MISPQILQSLLLGKLYDDDDDVNNDSGGGGGGVSFKYKINLFYSMIYNVKKKLLSVAIAVILWNKLSFFTNKSKLYYIMVLLFKVEQVVASGSFMERYA